MNEEEKNQTGNGFLIGFILGAITGAAFLFFFGTEKGRRLKKEIQKKGKFSFKSLADLLEEFEEKGIEFKKKAQQITDKLEMKKENAPQAVVKKTEAKLTHIKKLQEQGRKIARRFFKRNGKSLK